MHKFIFLFIFISLLSCNKKEIDMTEYWKEFQENNIEYKNTIQPQSFYFCDNKKDADECAELVVKKIKQATSPSVWWFEKNKEELPKCGDLAIVTDWSGNPKAIIRTTKIEIVKYKDITPEYAQLEGEGDKTLEYWKKVHWDYYTEEMNKFGEKPNEEMKIVCEYFETIW